MSFVTNSDHFSITAGVCNNANGNIIHYNCCGRRCHREIEDESLDSTDKRRRTEREDGIKVWELIHEIGGGPGYLIHAGTNKGRAVIVKVFNAGPSAREGRHPNVLRMEGVSASTSSTHFIAYQDVYWKNAEGPLAAALKDNLARSIRLGFKMNFDIFIDVGDRFVISVNPEEVIAVNAATQSSKLLGRFSMCCVRKSANRVLHDEQIERDPVALDSLPTTSFGFPTHPDSKWFENIPEDAPPVPPRREYVWRTIDQGEQSLASVARRMALELDFELTPMKRRVSTE
ncbi:hypothetical protein B0H13DRAFT_1936509, partial [Mycena leptocephala]